MNKKIVFYVLLSIIVLFQVYFSIIRFYSNEEKSQMKVSGSNCEINQVNYKVEGFSMQPLIENGEDISVLENYYSCGNQIGRGDVVIYQSPSSGLLVKIIKALPNDKLEIDIQNGFLFVNEEILTNSEGKKYVFDENELQFLGIYIHNGIMQKDAYFVFGDNIHISTDSRKFGAIGINGLLGKVVSY